MLCCGHTPTPLVFFLSLFLLGAPVSKSIVETQPSRVTLWSHARDSPASASRGVGINSVLPDSSFSAPPYLFIGWLIGWDAWLGWLSWFGFWFGLVVCETGSQVA